MREQLRGYTAAVLGTAQESGHLVTVAGELAALAGAVIDNESLYDVLCDAALSVVPPGRGG